MCLIAVAYKVMPDYDLLALANRDEFYARPTAPLHLWEPAGANWRGPVAGGQDLQAGGTWLAVARRDGQARFAAVTNYRNPDQALAARSRGELVTDFLGSPDNAADFAEALRGRSMQYGGFNLLMLDDSGLHYCTNRWPRQGEPAGFETMHQALGPGIYVLSNHLLDSPWPKSRRLRAGIKTLLETREGSQLPDAESWLDLMLDDTQADDAELPRTGLPVEQERELSRAFIKLPGYGTRCSTLVTIGRAPSAGLTISERRFGPDGFEGDAALTL